MSIQLSPCEMLEILEKIEHPDAPALKTSLIDVCRVMADYIAILTGTHCNTDAIEPWAGEIYAGFSGTGPILKLLEGYDDEGWEA